VTGLDLDMRPDADRGLFLPAAYAPPEPPHLVPLWGPRGDLLRRVMVTGTPVAPPVAAPSSAAPEVPAEATRGLGAPVAARAHTIRDAHTRRHRIRHRIYAAAAALGVVMALLVGGVGSQHSASPAHPPTTVTVTQPAPQPPAPRPPVRPTPPPSPGQPGQPGHPGHPGGPSGGHPAATDYVVQPGDNLWDIATDHGESLARAEHDNPQLHIRGHGFNLIFPGQHVTLHPGQAVVEGHDGDE
jgi:hypothetical protein